jgi:hypothetical protein
MSKSKRSSRRMLFANELCIECRIRRRLKDLAKRRQQPGVPLALKRLRFLRGAAVFGAVILMAMAGCNRRNDADRSQDLIKSAMIGMVGDNRLYAVEHEGHSMIVVDGHQATAIVLLPEQKQQAWAEPPYYYRVHPGHYVTRPYAYYYRAQPNILDSTMHEIAPPEPDDPPPAPPPPDPCSGDEPAFDDTPPPA